MKKLTHTLPLMFLMLLGWISVCQAQVDNNEVSDPEAMQLLQQISDTYQKGTGHKIEFSLDIELPAQGKETQKGQLIQQGDNFVLEMEGRKIISNGESVWLYMEDLNEVQINDADFEDETTFSSPSDIFKLHTSGEYIFAVSNKFDEEGAAVTQIEGKPTDSYSEYSKMRLTVIDKGLNVKRLKIFGKDGSRYTMNIISHNDAYTPAAGVFGFDASQYEGVHVEDLRF